MTEVVPATTMDRKNVYLYSTMLLCQVDYRLSDRGDSCNDYGECEPKNMSWDCEIMVIH